jgi:SEC-C motif
MDNDAVIVTACDQRYFPLCVDLIASIKNTCGFLPRIRVLDVGLLPGQIATLAGIVEKVIKPDWDIGRDVKWPGWYRAMTARPFLPKYAGNAELITWIDCDVWLQRREPVQALIHAARDGQLAIVEERFGKGFTVDARTAQGTFEPRIYNAENAKANTRSCYENCFGPDIATAFGDLPSFNSGVFALRADSPSWAVWQAICARAMARNFHFLAEQQALNVGIRQDLIPVSRQPHEANYTCHHELPWYSAESGAFTFPEAEDRVLGTIHLCDTKKYPLLPIPQFPHGRSSPMPLYYRLAQQFIGGKAKRLADGLAGDRASGGKPGRNALCPCGSGEKYKHCHGRIASVP